MREFLSSGTALATCHRTGFLDPWATKRLLRMVIGAYFVKVVLPSIP